MDKCQNEMYVFCTQNTLVVFCSRANPFVGAGTHLPELLMDLTDPGALEDTSTQAKCYNAYFLSHCRMSPIIFLTSLSTMESMQMFNQLVSRNCTLNNEIIIIIMK